LFVCYNFFSLVKFKMSVLLIYIQTICFDFNKKKKKIFILISFTSFYSFFHLCSLLFISVLFHNMISESFRTYPNKCLLGLSGHPLSNYYRTTHNMLSHAWIVTLAWGCVGDLTSTRDKDNSLHISGCKPHLMSWFYGIELDLKSTS